LEAREFVDKLICEPELRTGRGGLEDFKKLKFFSGFDWDHIREMTPPFVPKLASETDNSYFELQSNNTETETDQFNILAENLYLQPITGFTYSNLEDAMNDVESRNIIEDDQDNLNQEKSE